MTLNDEPLIAVLVPCLNEELTVGKVVRSFREALPSAQVYVYDNNSSDRTAEVAVAAGAIVRRSPLAGKGNVVRQMLADVEADVYLLVDGDDTYDSSAASSLAALVLSGGYDFVQGRRVPEDRHAYARAHAFGNAVLTGLRVACLAEVSRTCCRVTSRCQDVSSSHSLARRPASR